MRLAILPRQRKVPPNAIAGLLFLTVLFGVHAARAQESNIVIPPTPKAEPLEKVHHSAFALDRNSITVGLIQGSAELFDGFTTRYFVRRCSTCTEADPASRFLLGPRPSWTSMIIFGSLEAVATTYVHQTMRSSSHKFIRRVAAIMPIGIIGVHMTEGAGNLFTTPLIQSPKCAPQDAAMANQCPAPFSTKAAPIPPPHPRHAGRS